MLSQGMNLNKLIISVKRFKWPAQVVTLGALTVGGARVTRESSGQSSSNYKKYELAIFPRPVGIHVNLIALRSIE